ncbi:hypothetical protein ONQ62_27360, partial [Salmonella enterica subsp. enterica serovar Virginia]|nr:hypothetical protein [Salmonella enterica subsp. enterica serovar Virginia]
ILIDEARTPLIISGPAEDSSEMYKKVNKIIPHLIRQEKEDSDMDVLNGKAGSLNHHGYIVNAGDSLAIKGFRKDKHTEAAFQFA